MAASAANSSSAIIRTKNEVDFMALLAPHFLDCVVAIGVPRGSEKEWVASGFLYGEFQKKATDTKNTYQVYLVTNRHVFEDVDMVYLRFNPEEDQPAREYEVYTRKPDGSPKWFAHRDLEADVAVLTINAELLKQHHIKFSIFQSDIHVADRAKAIELGLTEGDGVYALGFPLGLIGGERNFVIVRQGGIARIRDALAGSSKEFLVDIPVFPGNSGGPVVTQPELTAIQGTKSAQASYLIGVVKAYVPYRDVAISTQTKRPRIIFEENSGLAAIVPIDFVKEVIQEHR